MPLWSSDLFYLFSILIHIIFISGSFLKTFAYGVLDSQVQDVAHELSIHSLFNSEYFLKLSYLIFLFSTFLFILFNASFYYLSQPSFIYWFLLWPTSLISFIVEFKSLYLISLSLGHHQSFSYFHIPNDVRKALIGVWFHYLFKISFTFRFSRGWLSS